ncbi:MAG: PLxRFG domain-containing protein, partial [Xanthomonadales bacterium]|nr:PLxRFG domain-containing protein [Xanthomonadales bacterium]
DQQVLSTLAHESIGHYGVERIVNDVLGNNAWGEIEASAHALRAKMLAAQAANRAAGRDANAGLSKMQALLAEVQRRYGADTDPLAFAKETLAVMSEKGIRNTWTDKVMTALRQWLRKIMPNLTLAPAELRQLLVASERYLRAAPVEDTYRQRVARVAAASFARAPGIDSDAFKRWFGDWTGAAKAAVSKVVNADGSPRVMYHGTGEDFWTFADDRLGASTGHMTAPLGHFFAEDHAKAERYAEKAANGVPADERVIDAYLDIKKPKTMTLDEFMAIDSQDESRALKAKLEAQGYDGIHFAEAGQWIAFHNTQIKSASDNVGTFDATNPDMRFALPSEAKGNFSLPEANFAAIDAIQQKPDAAAWDKAKAWMSGKWTDLAPITLGALQLRHVLELMESVPLIKPSAKNYAHWFQSMDADRNAIQTGSADKEDHPNDVWKQGASAHVKGWRAWAYPGIRGLLGKESDRSKRLSRFMNAATVASVDPSEDYKPIAVEVKGEYVPWTKDIARARIKVLKNLIRGAPADDKAVWMDEIKFLRSMPHIEKQRQADYARLKAAWEQMEPEAQRIYRDTRDWYKANQRETEAALLDRVAGLAGMPEGRRAALQAYIRLRFEKNRVEGVYFPLDRNGEYWMSITDSKGSQGFQMFEKAGELKAAAEKMRAKGFTVSTGRKSDTPNSKNVVPGSFLADTLKRDGHAPEKVMDEVYQLFLQSLPEMSMRKHFVHRRKVPGYEADQLRTYAKNSFHASHQLARLRWSHLMENAIDVMRNQIDDAREKM